MGAHVLGRDLHVCAYESKKNLSCTGLINPSSLRMLFTTSILVHWPKFQDHSWLRYLHGRPVTMQPRGTDTSGSGNAFKDMVY